jgi:hypothetical protein
VHRADGCFERAEAAILERSAWRQNRLFADNARTFDAFDLAIGIGDDPFTRDELRRF